MYSIDRQVTILRILLQGKGIRLGYSIKVGDAAGRLTKSRNLRFAKTMGATGFKFYTQLPRDIKVLP